MDAPLIRDRQEISVQAELFRVHGIDIGAGLQIVVVQWIVDIILGGENFIFENLLNCI